MLTDAADAFRLGLWGDLAFIGDPAVVKEENEVHVQRSALVQLQRDQRQNEVLWPPPHRPPRNGRLQSMLGEDAPGAHQASPSTSGLYCPWLFPLHLLPDAHLIYSTVLSALPSVFTVSLRCLPSPLLSNASSPVLNLRLILCNGQHGKAHDRVKNSFG